jgi:hypothetical protein
VTEHVVVDLQHAAELVEGLRRRGESQQVVDPVVLLVDGVRELAPAPRVMALERPPTLLDERLRTLVDLGLLLVLLLGVVL